MPARNPAKDQVAIVGVGLARYSRDNTGRTLTGLALEACRSAIADAGLEAPDIDGICGSSVPFWDVQSSLGIPETTWGANPRVPFAFQIIDAMNAVYSGACTTAVAYHSTIRPPGSMEATVDPLRLRAIEAGEHAPAPEVGSMAHGGVGYAAWAGRYLHQFNAGRDTLGLIAINNRTNAAQNPNAVLRQPLTMDDYLGVRMIRDPLCLYDLDVFVDAADALVITTTERARDLPQVPVLIHAATTGRAELNREDQMDGLHTNGQAVAARQLWDKSELMLEDMEVLYAYDGFSIINLLWLESLGYCGPGEAKDLLPASWRAEQNRLVLPPRGVLVNPHGGSLSEGGTQGSGAARDAVIQLRGQAGARQVYGVKTALLAIGGVLWNPGLIVLRTS